MMANQKQFYSHTVITIYRRTPRLQLFGENQIWQKKWKQNGKGQVATIEIRKLGAPSLFDQITKKRDGRGPLDYREKGTEIACTTLGVQCQPNKSSDINYQTFNYIRAGLTKLQR